MDKKERKEQKILDRKSSGSDYSSDFLREEIKNRPVNRRRLARRLLLVACMAAVFGTVACLFFLLLEPVLSRVLNPEEEQVQGVVYPEEQPYEELTPEEMVENEEEIAATFEQEQIREEVQRYLREGGLDSVTYEQIVGGLKTVADSCVPWLAEVSEISQDRDWFNAPYESRGTTAGIVIATGESDVLVLACAPGIDSAQRIQVSIYGGLNGKASIQGYDKNTGLAVLRLPVRDLHRAGENIEYEEIEEGNSINGEEGSGEENKDDGGSGEAEGSGEGEEAGDGSGEDEEGEEAGDENGEAEGNEEGSEGSGEDVEGEEAEESAETEGSDEEIEAEDSAEDEESGEAEDNAEDEGSGEAEDNAEDEGSGGENGSEGAGEAEENADDEESGEEDGSEGSGQTSDQNTAESTEEVPEDILTTLSRVKAATLGSSAGSLLIGRTVVAVGMPAGTSGSVSYGFISSVAPGITVTDAQYRQITTDIYGGTSSSGALVNMRGEVIGIIDTSHRRSDMPQALCGIGITELKVLIEHLSAGKSVPYFGLRFTDVPQDIRSAQNIPAGVYISGVEEDSPALNAGIQKGDILTGFGGSEITSALVLQRMLLHAEPSESVQVRVERLSGTEYAEMTLTVEPK